MAARTASRMPSRSDRDMLVAGEQSRGERSLSLSHLWETAGEGATPVGDRPGDRPEGAVRTAPESSRCAISCNLILRRLTNTDTVNAPILTPGRSPNAL